MPADIEKLKICLAQMKDIYLNNPIAAVRASSFINLLHKYCKNELYHALDRDRVQKIALKDMALPTGRPHYPKVAIQPDKFQLMREATLFGSHKN